MSITKLADAFEAQFFQTVKMLEETDKDSNNSKRANSRESFLAEESKFFENMTIHKQYQEYAQIKKHTFELVKSVNKWSTLFLLAGILYGLFMFMMLFPT